MKIDLNADLGEGSGFDEELLELVSSANIATGLHAGDPVSIARTIRLAQERGVAVGAHPSFADRENFGRKEMSLPPGAVFALVTYQLGAFRALAEAEGVRMSHVKPHGALYNMAARDAQIAEAIVRAMDGSALLYALPQSELERAARAAGVEVAREVFADRNYMPDGSLVPRDRADALLHDPTAAAERVVEMLRSGMVRAIDGSRVSVAAETVCVHGDTPGAVEFVRELRRELERNGIDVAAVGAGAPSRPDGAGAPSRRRAESGVRGGEEASTRRGGGAPAPSGRGGATAPTAPGGAVRGGLRRPYRHLPHVPAFADSPIVFLTTCTHRRRPVLAHADCLEVLRGLWERSADHDGWWVGHFILMPDHVHLFARPAREARPLASWVQMWKGVSSRKISAALGVKSPVWQAEYFDRFLRSSDNYSEKWDYVEQNPVRAGLVTAAADWPYQGTIHDLRF
ncbi:hypothetical protein BH20VER1_BH20VER1_28210 [soil metagenome]